MKKLAIAILAAVLGTVAALAFDEIPVYGGSKVGYEDRDLLDGTILEEGVLVVTPEEPWRVFIGDGVTPGGLEVHPLGCVTQFDQIASATTNLDMHSYSITFGPWAVHGDANELDWTFGGADSWLRFVRDTGSAYLNYQMTIIDTMHYKFDLAWSGTGYDFPLLQVTTNLLNGFTNASMMDVDYFQPDSSHLEITYTVPEEYADYVVLSFLLFDPHRLETGVYVDVPFKANQGLTVTRTLVVTGRMESVHSEGGGGEDRDEYVPGSITLNGVTWTEFPVIEGFATTDSVNAAVARIGTLETNAATHATRDWTVAYVATNHQSLDGYATEEWVGEQGYLTEHQSLADYALTSWTIGYVATNHQSLAGYATESWVQGRGYLTEHQSLAGLASESWVSEYVSTNHQSLAGLASETWVSDYVATNHQSLAGLASEMWVEGYVSTNHQSLAGYATEAWTEAYISTNHQDLSSYATTAAVESVSGRVDAIEADYVVSDDIAGFATTSTVASVERRVETLERTDTCLLWWTTNLTSETTYWIPTNFPTRRLEIRADRGGLTNIVIAVNGAYDYGRDVEIDVVFCATTAGHGIVRCMGAGGGYVSMGNVNGTTLRSYTFQFDNVTKTMRSLGVSPAITAANMLSVTFANGSPISTPTGPCSVEEWLALHPEWVTP